jgi:hypothetical protein
MKRDMDLVRRILLCIEEQPLNYAGIELSIDGWDQESISEHVRMLAKAGYVEAMDVSTYKGADWRPVRMTWEGHDFLDAARNDTLWGKAKSKLADVGIGLSMEVMKATLIALAKEKLKIS